MAASDIASYAHDNTLHACDSNLYTVLSKLENCTHSTFTGFKKNNMKQNEEKWHLLVTTEKSVCQHRLKQCKKIKRNKKLLGIKFEGHIKSL